MVAAQNNLPALLRDIELGPAMSRLTDKQREFVYAMIEQGGRSFAAAARAAGYEGDQNAMGVAGHRLAHDTRIQEAMREMGPKILNAGIFIAAKFVLEAIDNPQFETKDRLKAAEMVMNRTGMHQTTEHKVAVTHRSENSKEMLERIEQMAKKHGIDPAKLLGNCIDAEFEEVDDLGDIF